MDRLSTDSVRWGTFVRCPNPEMLEAITAEGFDLVVLEISPSDNDRYIASTVTAAKRFDIEVCLRIASGKLSDLNAGLGLGVDWIQVRSVRDDSDLIDFLTERAPTLPLETNGAASENPFPRLIIEIDFRSKAQDVAHIAKMAPPGSVFLVVPSNTLVIPHEQRNFLKLEETLAVDAILEVCNEQHLSVGIYTDSPRDAGYWQTRGIDLIEFGTDIDIFRSGVSWARRQMKNRRSR